jgi:hypothetical protein
MILPTEDRVGSGVIYELKGDQVVRTKMGVLTVLATMTGEKKDNIEYTNEEALTKRQQVITCLNELHIAHKTESVKGVKLDTIKKNEPPRPKMNPMDGDKTPAVFDWYQQWRPQESRIRYGILGTFDVDVPNLDEYGQIQRDPNTGIMKMLTLSDQLCARRVVEGRTIRPPDGHPAWDNAIVEEVD